MSNHESAHFILAAAGSTLTDVYQDKPSGMPPPLSLSLSRHPYKDKYQSRGGITAAVGP